MVELQGLPPGRCRVARLTAHRLALRSWLPHARGEFPMMGVVMAFLADQIREVVRHGEVRRGVLLCLMALPTRCGDVAAG